MRLRRLVRSPLVFWAATLGLAGLTGLTVAGAVGRAQALAARYGGLTTVAVAARPIAAGDRIGPSDVHLRRRPREVTPAGALTVDPAGRTALAPLFPGEPVLRQRLAPWGRHGVAALVPPGGRAVAVPTGRARPAVRQGDLVDVLASADPTAAGDAVGSPGSTAVIATEAVVVAVGAEQVTVAVPAGDVRAVAHAAAVGVVTLAVRGADP